jgi:hypothetical protein
MVSLDERVSRLEAKMESLATKEDLAILRADMVEQMATMRSDMMDQMAVLRADMTEQLAINRSDMIDRIGQQRAESKEMETRLIKWMVGTVLAGMTLAASLTVALQNLL